ncbi:MAG: hypothetical protein JW836_12195 [Deltaproteobacteria bacterium]|nr:hypothetical protein [Deltaproteobacteria bacterium]
MNAKPRTAGRALLIAVLMFAGGCAWLRTAEEAVDLKTELKNNNELDILKDYEDNVFNYWTVLQREINTLKKEHPQYSNYDVIIMHRELRQKGINYYKEVKEAHEKHKRGELPPGIDSVIEYVEYKKRLGESQNHSPKSSSGTLSRE